MSRLAPLTLLFATLMAQASSANQPAEVVWVQTASVKPARTVQKVEVYRFQQADGVVGYSDQPPPAQVYEVLYFEHCFACDPYSPIDWSRTTLFTQRFKQEIEAAAHSYGVEVALLCALIHAESAFNPLALSRKGAMGLMQLMPETARELGVSDPFMPQQNIFGGARYLAMLLTRYHGDIALAAAAYNAGSGAVERYGGIPPYAETQAYVQRVQLLHRRYQAVLTPVNG